MPGPMMGDTSWGVVARRMWLSRVASFGRVTHAPADPRALYRASDGYYYTRLGRRPGAPKWVPGWCGRRGGGGGVFVLLVRIVQVPQMLVVEVVEIPQLQLIEKIVAIPGFGDVVAQKTVEAPQLQFVDEVVVFPVVAQR